MTLKRIEKPEIDKKFLSSLPKSPGVYIMKDGLGEVIYIGKAKNLKLRVRSYFSSTSDGRQSFFYIQDSVCKIETLITESERQALILEADLIRKYKPRYNVRLKDDKSPLMVRIDWNKDWPRLELVRKTFNDNAEYIGPFTFSYELRVMLNAIKACVPLRTCSDRVFKNRVRPCLEYQIKRCPAPCCLEVDRGEYKESLMQAIKVLKGSTDNLILDFEEAIEKCIKSLRFEDAVIYRDRIAVLKKVSSNVVDVNYNSQSSDSIGIYREGDKVEVSLLSVKNGRLLGAKSFSFEKVTQSNKQILSSLLMQFYSDKSKIPREIYLPLLLDDLESHEEVHTDKAGFRVKINTPKLGDKKRLLELAKKNARENFEATFLTHEKGDRISKSLQHHFKLEDSPRVIECIDISHHQGEQTVGVVVCFKDGKPEKSRYRRFNLDFDGKADDFASIREVVVRHLSRCNEENNLCDLLVIDGGRAQLTQALDARKEIGINYPAIIAIAKRRNAKLSKYADVRVANSKLGKPERFFIEGVSQAINMAEDSDESLFLQKLRNETHRFAISTHRKKARNSRLKSSLESVPGLGSVRIKKILKSIKNTKEISLLTAAELSLKAEIPESLAIKIKKQFKS